MRSAMQLVLGMALAAAVVSGNTAAQAQSKKTGGGPAYDVVRLEFPGSAPRSTWAYDLSNRGNVVGEYDDAAGTVYGYHYEAATGTYQSLGAGVIAYGINDFDEIVGTDEIGNVGLYWSSPGADPVALPPLAGHTHSQARALNSAGIIIGSSYIPEDAPVTPGFRAVVAWYVNPLGGVSGPVELPYLAGDIAGGAYALTETANGSATVVGASGWSGWEPTLPVSWTVTIVGDSLTVTGPSQFDGDYFLAEPWGINNLGDAVGRAAFAEGAPGMPFLRRAGGTVSPLRMLSNAVSGSATDINDAGRIVGGQSVTVKPSGVVTRAVLWTSPTTVVDLNSLVSLGRGESLTWSQRINGSGDILAIVNGGTPCLLIPR